MDPTILTLVLTLMGGAISTLFGIIIADQRSHAKQREERITRLEDDLKASRDVIGDVTQTIGKFTETQDELVEVVYDIMVLLSGGNQPRRRGTRRVIHPREEPKP